MKNFLKKSSALFLVVIVITSSIMSCSSSTLISSRPPEAKVYVNGEFKGTTPYKHSDQSISGTTSQIEMKKEGYEDFITMLSKNEQVNVGAVVGGLFFLFPFIWTMGYNPTHTYELIPLQPVE